MILSQIAAMASNRTIGSKGQLPWSLPEDLKYFKEKTKNHIIIMGRKTFESLPKPLPHRLNIVVTRQKEYRVPEGVIVFQSLKEAFDYSQTQISKWDPEVFIVGGSEIYRQTLDFTTNLYITEIQKDFPGDAHFPEWNESFVLAQKEERFEPMNYAFCHYVNSSPKPVSV